MNVTAASIAWAFLQIAMLCSITLLIAWALRGRRPQFVTAILAGTCIASLLLATISIVPRLQWTLAFPDVPAIQPRTVESSRSQINEPQQVAIADQNAAKPSQNDGLLTTEGNAGSIRFHALDAMRSFLSRSLQRVDREVREAEAWQQPVAMTRNVSLLLFLLLGLVAMSLLWCSSWLYMRRVLRCSESVQDHSVVEFIAAQAREFGLKRTPSIRQSSQVPIGATVGWRRVTVLLHSDWREWTIEERMAVISHELAHAARHDFAWVIISSWTRIFLFFHPMVHLLIHRLRLEQELAADQLAAGKVGSAKAYGRALASLALRGQQSLGTSNARLGSMLAAGQICVTRRIIMLKQGSLKPISSRTRWSIWAASAIACTAIPLAGLRGITQDPVANNKPVSDSPVSSDSETQTKPKPLSKEFLAAFPPVEFKGAMIYRPGRLRAGEFGPEAAWFQEWFAISSLGRPMPDRAIAHGECSGILKWTDEERQHGGFFVTVGFKEGEATAPGQLSKLIDPYNDVGRKMRTVSQFRINDRTILGVTNSKDSDEPEKWLIDDEQGYFLGSREQALEFARGQKFALDAIPETFRDDFQNAAFGLVFDHVDQWTSKLEAFYKDSPKADDFQVFGFKPTSNLIKDMLQVGVFFDGCRTPACNVRAAMRDARAAKRLATQVTTLVGLGKIAMDTWPSESDPAGKEAATSLLETMKITVAEEQVLFQFDLFIPSLSKLDGQMASTLATAGWININTASKCEALGSITVLPEMSFTAQPSMFGQTLNAIDYRGQTVLLELEMQHNVVDASDCGAFVWASRKEQSNVDLYSGRVPRNQGSQYVGHRVISAKSVAANGVANWSDLLSAERRLQGVALLPDAPSRTLAIAFDVPTDAEHISFGCYSKNSEIRMSNVKFQTVDHADKRVANQGVQDATADVPYNVMVVPGYTIRKTPVELNFEKSVPRSIEFTAKPAGNLK